MAMIKCSECGKDISSQAEICPHCGKRLAASPVTQDMAEVYARRNKVEKEQEKETEKVLGCLFKTIKVLLVSLAVCILLIIVLRMIFF